MKIRLLDIGVRDRFRQDVGNIEELAKDFREHGQITPITVRKTSDDDRLEGFSEPFMLVAGGRRYMSAMLNEWEEIKAEAFEELPPLQRAIMELHENIMRKDMSWQEVVAMKAEIHRLRMLANPKQRLFETANELKDSHINFSRDMRLAQAMEEHPELARAGSKRAAVRMMEMAEHVTTVSRQSAESANKVDAVKSALHTADAREFLAALAPGSIDMLYSDPLWGIDYFSQGHKTEREGDESLHLSEYDDSFENMEDVMLDCLPKMVRAVKPEGWIALHCGYDAYRTWRAYVEDLCVNCYNYISLGKCSCIADRQVLRPEPIPWIWHRPNSQNRSRHPDLHEDNRYEFLLVVNRGNAKLYRQHLGNVLVHDAEYGNRIHSMQKPIAVCQDVISRLTLPQMIVVDPFFGSGALLAGAASLQRRFMGCDLNPALLMPATGLITQSLP